MTVGSNPNYSNLSDSSTVLASMTILSDGSLSFNDVTLGRRYKLLPCLLHLQCPLEPIPAAFMTRAKSGNDNK